MREVVEMAQILLEMGTDIYMKSKYALLAISSKHPTDRAFFDVLFDRIDKKRPLLITDKKGGAA